MTAHQNHLQSFLKIQTFRLQASSREPEWVGMGLKHQYIIFFYISMCYVRTTVLSHRLVNETLHFSSQLFLPGSKAWKGDGRTMLRVQPLDILVLPVNKLMGETVCLDIRSWENKLNFNAFIIQIISCIISALLKRLVY